MDEDNFECAICLDEITEFAVPFSSNQILGQKQCKHNFCFTCLKNYVENLIGKGQELSCPVCRELFQGFINNRSSNDIAKVAKQHSSTAKFLKVENQNLNNQLNDIKNQMDSQKQLLTEKLADVENQKSVTVKEINLLKNKMGDLEKELSEKHQERLKEIEVNQSKLYGQQQEILALNQTKSELEESYQNLYQQLNQHNERSNSLLSKLENYKQRNTSLEEHISQLEQERRQIQSKLESIESQTEKRIQEQLLLTKQQDTKVQQLHSIIEPQRLEIQALKSKLNESKKALDSTAGDSQKLLDIESAMSQLHVELARSHTVIETLNSKKKSLEKELEEFKRIKFNSSPSSLDMSSTANSILAATTKLSNKSLNLFNSGINYLYGNNNNPYQMNNINNNNNNSNLFIKSYKNFKIYEKRGNNKNSQIFRATLNNFNMVLKLIPFFKPMSTISSLYLSLTTGNTITQEQDISVFREAMILYTLNHSNILKLESITKDENTGKIYSALSPFVPFDLEYLIAENCRSSNSNGGNLLNSSGGSKKNSVLTTTLTFLNIKQIIYQLINTMAYIHSQELVHRDIKPTSILLFEDFQIKLCSFGQSCSVFTSFQNNIQIPNYSQSNFAYLAPEVILAILSNSNNTADINWKAVDMWSIGSIFLELLLKKNVFLNSIQKPSSLNNSGNGTPTFSLPKTAATNNRKTTMKASFGDDVGDDELSIDDFEQLRVPGNTKRQDLTCILDFMKMNSIQKILKENLNTSMPEQQQIKDAFDLLLALLDPRPDRRITAQNASLHRFFSNESYFNAHDQPSLATSDVSSSLTDTKIKDFLQEKCFDIVSF
ncbi:hypothetical protein CYY_004665 [Polysphondylium violaceum]|uniref:Protein kinase domain-containing protein n=1 Tax=Polysphondylium violaceum TaxID=133409 RepID=A0A8J4PWH9_9MYCE|nr:hypothetical protein CYY_004665 [Polysphondylium violaceum]